MGFKVISKYLYRIYLQYQFYFELTYIIPKLAGSYHKKRKESESLSLVYYTIYLLTTLLISLYSDFVTMCKMLEEN